MNESISTSRSDFDVVLGVLRRRRGVIVLCALLATGAALGFSLIAQKKYTATASLLFSPSQPSQALNLAAAGPPVSLSATDTATNLKLVDLYAVSEAAARALPAPYNHVTPGFVRRALSVSSEGASNVVDIVVTTTSPQLSAVIANTYAEQFIAGRIRDDQAAYTQAERLVQTQLSNPRSLSRSERQTLQSEAQQLRLLSVMQTGNAALAQPAEAPGSPSSPRIERNTVLGLVVGLILAFALAFLLERLNRRINDLDDLEATFELPLLGVVPESRAFDDLPPTELPIREAEAFRMLRARLRYFNVDRDIRSLLVVSAAPNDGKSTIAYHLARTAAGSGGARVILVEADLRKPRLASRAGLKLAPGLAELLTQTPRIGDVIQRVRTGLETSADEENALDVIVAGERPPNPSELIESQKMSQLLAFLKQHYDLVVIDTPPTAVVSDAIPLVRLVDGVVIVTRMNRSTKMGISRLRDQLKSLGAPVLGAVANHFVARRGDDYGDGDGYYSTVSSSKRKAPRSGSPPASNGGGPPPSTEERATKTPPATWG